MRAVPVFSKLRRGPPTQKRQVIDRGEPLCEKCSDNCFIGDAGKADHSWLMLGPLFERSVIRLCECEAAAIWRDFLEYPAPLLAKGSRSSELKGAKNK